MKILVTGSGGFLGKAIIKELLSEGHQLSTINRQPYPELEAMGVTCYQGDIRSLDDVEMAVAGVDAVIHSAAKAGMWGDYEDYFQINVVGTENIISACKKFKISKLVYTSSPSVTFDGNDQEGVDESAAYPDSFTAHYPKTKAIAEQKVLSSGDESLSVVALRPHLIWGPGDNHLAPRLIDRQKSKRLRFIGKSSSKVDAVYIDNAAHAHTLALEKLSPSSIINGKAYFISNQDPWPTEKLINTILFSAGIDPVTKRVPYGLAMTVAVAFEYIYAFFKIKRDPPMTRFVALQLSSSHWFDSRAAKEELGYVPRVSMVEGFRRLREHYRMVVAED